MSPPTQELIDHNRAYAEKVLTRVARDQTFAAEQMAAFGKWLTASLLAVNGAGAIATLNAERVGQHDFWAGGVYIAGVLFALLGAAGLQEVYDRRSKPLIEYDKYWLAVSFSGKRDEEAERALKDAIGAAGRFALLAQLLGWLSGLLFAIGSALLIWGASAIRRIRVVVYWPSGSSSGTRTSGCVYGLPAP